MDDLRAGTAANLQDLRAHLANLERAGKLVRVTRPINKDTELMPLVRWQFRGGIEEKDRKAFLFTNVTDSKKRKFDIPVVVGVLAANREIYRLGMNCDLDKINQTWIDAMANPIPPNVVTDASCQEIVIEGKELDKPGKGLDAIPVPISTPGFDAAPYLTATLCVTKDPESGIQNMGTYRGQLKATDRLGVRMASRIGGTGGCVSSPGVSPCVLNDRNVVASTGDTG